MTRPALTPWGRLGVPSGEIYQWCAGFDDWTGGSGAPPPFREPEIFPGEWCFRKAAGALAERAAYLNQTTAKERSKADRHGHPLVAGLNLGDVQAMIYGIAVRYEDERCPLPPEVMSALFHSLTLTDWRRPSGGLARTQLHRTLGLPNVQRSGDFVAAARWEAENPEASDKQICKEFGIDAKTLRVWRAYDSWQRLVDEHVTRDATAASWKAAFQRTPKK